jgi:hypothetical protein
MEDIVLERFRSRIEDLGLSIDHIDDDGLIFITAGDEIFQISLDNVRKSYEQEGGFDHLDSLIASLHNSLIEPEFPEWAKAKENVFLSLFPSDFNYDDIVYEPVSKDFIKHYVYYEHERYNWITLPQLEKWRIDEATLKAQVYDNMNMLLDASTIKTTTLESGEMLAYFETEMEGLKSALLFAGNLKEKLQPVLGWPVYAVLPLRDFCYIFSEKDKSTLTELLADTVIKAYQEQGYEITSEIIRISDVGIQAIGKYKTD